jgi:hypothetical protein
MTQISYTPVVRVFDTKFLINMPNHNIIGGEIINLKISETGNDIILAEQRYYYNSYIFASISFNNPA